MFMADKNFIAINLTAYELILLHLIKFIHTLNLRKIITIESYAAKLSNSIS